MRGRPPLREFAVTDRQREVARLVAEGKTNPEIAEALGISLDGAKYHVSELLARLAFERREDIAAWYRAQQGSRLERARRRLRAALGLPVAWGTGAAAVVVLVGAVIVALGGASEGAQADNAPAAVPTASPTATTGVGETIALAQAGPAAPIRVAGFEHHEAGDQ